METGKTTVRVGNLCLGPGQPVLIQSMCNVSVLDTRRCVEQCIRIFNAGGGLVRMAVRNLEEARNLKNIRRELHRRGYDQPISADVHFNPALAVESAPWVDKVRINPGNFTPGNIEKPFMPLIEACRKHNTAIRVGVNHGSLSERILEKFGDTPAGMAESALEYLRVCKRENFSNVVVSLKSSNTRIMVYSNRLMKQRMEEEKLDFPLHLGVTEAGAGEEGRIRSAAGIGTLLHEGLGDTIRVSLTEDPELEIPAAKLLLEAAAGSNKTSGSPPVISFERRESERMDGIGGGQVPVVVARLDKEMLQASGEYAPQTGNASEPDYYFVPDHLLAGDLPEKKKYILSSEAWKLDDYPRESFSPLYDLKTYLNAEKISERMNFVLIRPEESNEVIKLAEDVKTPCCLVCMNGSPQLLETVFSKPAGNRISRMPVLVHAAYRVPEKERFILQAATDLSCYFIDGQVDGLWLDNPFFGAGTCSRTAFRILQACRSRISETDYIACPSCARTLFDIQETLSAVREATSQLRHLKIAVMGCIVNGPGEMADADYGYVGSARGKINLYRHRQLVKKNIAEKDAVNELVNLIRENGDWTD